MTTVDRVLVEFIGSADSVVAAASKTQAAVNGVTATTKAAGIETATLGTKSTTSFAQMGAAASRVGGTLTKYVSLPLAVAGAASIKMASDFQSSMLLIHTQAGASTGELNRMTQAVLAMAPAVGFGPNALAQALYHIESIGLRGGTALDTLKYAAEGAQVGVANLEDVANALGAVMISGIKGVSGAADAMGQMNAIVGAGNIRMEDLASVMGNLIPISVSAGLSLKSMGAGLAVLTDMGMPADEAATRLRMAIALMIGPSQKASDELNALGMSASDIQSHFADAPAALQKVGLSITTLAGDLRQPNGLFVAMTDLKAHLEAADKAFHLTGQAADEYNAAIIKAAFGGAKAGTGFLALYDNMSRLPGKFQQITALTSGFGAAWQRTSETTRVAIDQALAAASVAAIKIGADLAPAVKTAAHDLQDLAHWFSELSPGVQHAIIDFGLFLAVLGPVMKLFGTLSTAVRGVQTIFNFFKGAQAAGQIAELGTSAEGAAVEVGVLGSSMSALGATFTGFGVLLAGLAIGTVIDKLFVAPVIRGIEKAHDVVATNTEDMKNRFVTQLNAMKGVTSTDMGSIVQDLNKLDAAGKLNDVSMQNLQGDIALLGQVAAAHIPVTTAQMEALAGGGRTAAGAVSQLKAELAAAAGIRVSGVTVSVASLSTALGISHDKAVSVIAQLAAMEASHVDPGAMGVDTLMNSLGLTHDQAQALYNTLHSLDGLHVTSYATVVATLQQATSDASAIRGATTAPSGDVSGMALGGDVFAKTPYVVGEHGPELFMSDVDGTIIPHNKSMSLINMLNRKRGVGTIAGTASGGVTGTVRGSGFSAVSLVVNNHGTVITEREFEDFMKELLYRLGFRNGTTGIR